MVTSTPPSGALTRKSSLGRLVGRVPSAIICKACNREFFAQSLSIHQKTCFRKHAFVNIVCAACHTTIQSGCFHAHQESCQGVVPSLLDVPSSERVLHGVDYPAAQLVGDGSRQLQAERAEELNAPDEDGHVRCRKCERGFHEDRIAKRQSVCRHTPQKRSAAKPSYDPASAAEKNARKNPLHQYRARSETKRSESSAGAHVVAPLSYNAQPLQLVNTSRSHPAVSKSRSYRSASVFNQQAHHHRDSVHDREKPRFDIVLRDTAARQSLTGTTSVGASRAAPGGWSAKALNLVASNASSSSNPLATSQLMTMTSIH